MDRNHARLLQESCKNYPKILQESSKNLARFIQDPNKILTRSCNNYPRIIWKSCKYYPRIIQESCNINLRIMQDVLKFVKIAFFCLPKGFEKLIARCVQSVHSVHVFLKIETIHFTIHYQSQTMTQHFLVRPCGTPTSPEIKTEWERKREQFVAHLYWLEYFSSYSK